MYREENAMVCIIYAPDGLPEAFNDYISGKKFIGKIDHIFIGNSIEEVNNLIEKSKQELMLTLHGRHWVVVGTEIIMPCRRWEGHYYVCESWDLKIFLELSSPIERFSERGCWWDNAYVEPEKKELYEDLEKVVFLDIDGVLNHLDGKNYIEKELLDNLATIIRETEAKIVLSSSWRRYYLGWAQRAFPIERDDFGWFLDDKLASVGLHIDGVTPIIFDGPEGRPFEIRSFLSNQARLRSFVILDDEPFWKWNWLSNYVVQTDDRRTYDRSYVCGLSERKAHKAIRLLNG